MQPEPHTQFPGTYFDKQNVLRTGLWARIVAWAVLTIFTLDGGYTAYQAVYNALAGGYPVDPSFVVSLLLRIIQGAALFVVLRLMAALALILLDIEDNTRRAARK
jgi:hypothetical protein